MVLKQVAVVNVADPRLRINIERIDPFALGAKPLSRLNNSTTCSIYLPAQHALTAHHWPFDKRAGVSNQISNEVVKRITPAALRKLILNLELHLVGANLRLLQNIKAVVLRHHLSDFTYLASVGCFAVLLNHLEHALCKDALHFFGLRRAEIGNRCWV